MLFPVNYGLGTNILSSQRPQSNETAWRGLVLFTRKWAFSEDFRANPFLNGALGRWYGLGVGSFSPIMKDLSLTWQWISPSAPLPGCYTADGYREQ